MDGATTLDHRERLRIRLNWLRNESRTRQMKSHSRRQNHHAKHEETHQQWQASDQPCPHCSRSDGWHYGWCQTN